MADTLTTTTTVSTIPSGSVIATDDAGAGGHVQIVKLALSADGSASPIAADANGLEVQGAGTAGSAAGGVVTVQGVASMTPVQVGDNSGSLTVDNATLSVTGGGVEASALRVTLASDSTGVVSVDDNGSTLSVDDGGSSLTVDGTVTSTPAGASTATITTQADQASSATLLASNANRRAAIIVNDSSVALYVKYGATATSSDWTYKLEAGEALREEIYTGRIDGIWASNASGQARMTELTA
jgi:hypothetical protein